MHDDEGSRAATAGDDEQAEALSRAAREAVRQPADPRLERSFARLGLFTDDATEPNGAPEAGAAPDGAAPAGAVAAATPPAATPPAATPPGAPSPTASTEPVLPPAEPRAPAAGVPPAAPDLEPLSARLAELQATVQRLDTRLATVTWLLVGLVAAVAVLALLVLLR